jgi:hypothetical protein
MEQLFSTENQQATNRLLSRKKLDPVILSGAKDLQLGRELRARTADPSLRSG